MIKTSGIFLFSRFDSRGGSFAVKAGNKKQAVEAIVGEIFKADKEDPDFGILVEVVSYDFVVGPIDLYTDNQPVDKEDIIKGNMTEFAVEKGSKIVGIGVSETKLEDIKIEKFKINEMQLSEDAFGLIYLEV